MNKHILGLAAAIFGSSVAGASYLKPILPFDFAQRSPTENRSSTKKWRRSMPSEHFGKRSMAVYAFIPKTQSWKLMKLKNALKKNLQYEVA